MTALLLASTPLHSFWSLGLMHGPLRGEDCVLALIDQRERDQNYIADALIARAQPPVVDVQCFPRIGKSPFSKLRNARRVMRAVSDLSRRLQPSYVVVGNDRRAEFYAALFAAPNAIGAYVDDGMFSYMPMQSRHPSALARRWADHCRRLLYGVPVEHPGFVGGSRAAADAWVMLPQLVHEGLATKNVRAIEAAWFRQPGVQQVCSDAVALSGLDPSLVRGIQLLLVLPHDSFLRQHPQLAQRLADLAHDCVGRGANVAFKRHPRSTATDMNWLPPQSVEIPRRLPVEVLAPLLTGTLVVGTLTTALISLKCLGASTEVRSLVQIPDQHKQAAAVYRAAGIQPLE